MRIHFLILPLLFIKLMSYAQSENRYPMTDPQYLTDIDTYIAKEKNKANKTLLQKFKGSDSTSRITIQRETNKKYEIWVDHKSDDGYSWTEGLLLNKKTGKTEMIWHEHPVKNEPIIFEEIQSDTIKNKTIKKSFKCRKPINKEN